jgi:hypothetical protein
MFDVLMTMGNAVKLQRGGGADQSGRNSCESYVIREGELAGIIKLVTVWHAIGHSVSFFFFHFRRTD